MKTSGLNKSDLIDAYSKEVRSLLEMAVPVWHSGLTLDQQIKIERVQKSALSIILGKGYISYDNALKDTNLQRLSVRRDAICSRFINKNVKSERPIIQKVKKSYNTRSDLNFAKEINCRTQSFFKSSVPFSARKCNQNIKQKQKTTKMK